MSWHSLQLQTLASYKAFFNRHYQDYFFTAHSLCGVLKTSNPLHLWFCHYIQTPFMLPSNGTYDHMLLYKVVYPVPSCQRLETIEDNKFCKLAAVVNVINTKAQWQRTKMRSLGISTFSQLYIVMKFQIKKRHPVEHISLPRPHIFKQATIHCTHA